MANNSKINATPRKENGRSKKWSLAKIAIILSMLTLLVSGLMLAFYMGWIKIPNVEINVRPEVTIQNVDHKLVFQCFESMHNKSTGTGYIESCDAEIYPKADSQAAIHFKADAYMNGDKLEPFICIGLKEEDTPVERYYVYHQTSMGELHLLPGEYCLVLHFQHSNKYTFWGKTTLETQVRYFTLDSSDVKKLYSKKLAPWKHVVKTSLYEKE